MNFSWVVGVDNNLEDLLPWWYENIKKWAPEPHITICNFGMNSTARALAKKYADRGNDSLAMGLYENVLKSKNVSMEMFHEAKYFINAKLLWLQGPDTMLKYLDEYADSPFISDAVNQLLSYFKYISIIGKSTSMNFK